ncbi:MAG: hypothetical protein GC158_04355 [Cyanobacteria bacterium RI_101]|nr:hypothetical protein [Cyanobacteria bacterium RI_101]
MPLPTPVVFIHQGRSWYLPFALYQAQTYSPLSEVILLGDGQKLPGISCRFLRDYPSAEIEEFERRYVHLSSNSPQFERFCWLRWFYLLNYMEARGLDSVLYLDSDALLFGAVEDLSAHYGLENWPCAYLLPDKGQDYPGWSASGHVSYWTRAGLRDFCRYCLDSFQDPDSLRRYREKYQWHQDQALPGGVCDMTTLYFYAQDYPKRMLNLARRCQGVVIDNNMNFPDNYTEKEYQMRGNLKAVQWRDGLPYFRPQSSGEAPVLARVLHFQGGAKLNLSQYYQGRSFGGQNWGRFQALIRRQKRRLLARG